ncbi:MAG: DUF3575 domain-containing protein [Muribaculaceae bacterium]|nr:DUF3575 domain-containing protein [Muribaculaceae bacterium]
MKKLIPLIIILLAGSNHAFSRALTDTVTIGFRQSHIDVDPDYKNNGARLDSIFNRLSSDSVAGMRRLLRSVSVVGSASPEGSVAFNDYLSENRAEAIFDIFRERGIAVDSLTTFNYLGRDWNGLRRSVIADENVPYREDVLNLLDEITDYGSDARPGVEHPLIRLKSLHGGEPYMYLYKNIFPNLRFSTIVLDYDFSLRRISPSTDIELPMLPVSFTDVPGSLTLSPTPVKTHRPLYVGLKTNLLSDLLLIPHVGADIYVGRGWSVTADWMYGWWDVNRTHYYWRAYGGTLGARRWFGKAARRKPLTGHHVGVYAGVVTYDFELGGRGYMGGKPHGTLWDRCNVVAGVEYGYSLPVNRRLNIDFSIGIGYLGGTYYEYVPKGKYYIWQSTHRLRWFGPTKAEISLVWLVGRGNYNSRRGVTL